MSGDFDLLSDVKSEIAKITANKILRVDLLLADNSTPEGDRPEIIYKALADPGTAETAAAWIIDKFVLSYPAGSDSPNLVSSGKAIDVKWSEHLTETYS